MACTKPMLSSDFATERLLFLPDPRVTDDCDCFRFSCGLLFMGTGAGALLFSLFTGRGVGVLFMNVGMSCRSFGRPPQKDPPIGFIPFNACVVLSSFGALNNGTRVSSIPKPPSVGNRVMSSPYSM